MQVGASADGRRRLTLNFPEPAWAAARRCVLTPGTLNLFKGKYLAHRVTPVRGARARIITVFSYYQRPGVSFGADERREFYGRSEAAQGP